MARFIDLDEFFEENKGWLDGNTLVFSQKSLLQAPTEDVVMVVRCKDCVYRTEMGNCSHPKHVVLPTAYPMDFCSDGKRKGWQ